jgi:hypothetical protein
LLVSFLLLTLYRLLPNRPLGFAPQIAIALFSGSVIDKRYSPLLPLMSMFISDILFEIIYHNGFYDGQILNYLLFVSITFIGFFVNPSKFSNVLLGLVSAPTAYFLLSNFIVWASGNGYNRVNLIDTYIDGLPFYNGSLLATILFGSMFYVSYNIKNSLIRINI